MNTSSDLAGLVQALLNEQAPGQYVIAPETEHRFEGEGGAYRVTPTDGSERGAVFHLDDEVSKEHGTEAAARRLLRVIERVIGEGLPEKRAGHYVSYDAD